jgi:tRNA(adenine34) deaminase
MAFQWAAVSRSELQTAGNPKDLATSREIDDAMMQQCIALSRVAVAKGEYPFGTIIARHGEIVAQAINRAVRQRDVTRHAEVIALSQAQKKLSRQELRHCTLYSNIEPCAMCSYCIREAWIGRVVYALASPVMGGLSKWNLLRDTEMSGRMPQVFGPVPEVVSGVRVPEAQQAWRDWNPLAWQMIELRGLLTEPRAHDESVRVRPAHGRSVWHYLQGWYERVGQTCSEATATDTGDMDL